MIATLDYGPVRVATGTMGHKHDIASVKVGLSAPNYLLKIIPHVDGSPWICELVEYYMEDIDVKGAWTGPAVLSLAPHALAPVAELPVLEVVAAVHSVVNLTLGLGKEVHHYLRRAPVPSVVRSARWHALDGIRVAIFRLVYPVEHA